MNITVKPWLSHIIYYDTRVSRIYAYISEVIKHPSQYYYYYCVWLTIAKLDFCKSGHILLWHNSHNCIAIAGVFNWLTLHGNIPVRHIVWGWVNSVRYTGVSSYVWSIKMVELQSQVVMFPGNSFFDSPCIIWYHLVFTGIQPPQDWSDISKYRTGEGVLLISMPSTGRTTDGYVIDKLCINIILL